MYQKLSPIEFPIPRNRYANMMPFIMGENSSIPGEYWDYIPLIEACEIEPEEMGNIGYLSINESYVTPGLSQRRPGVHVERHPMASWGGGAWGGGSTPAPTPEKPKPKPRVQGIYLGSNVPDSCAIADTLIPVEEVRKGGDCSHLDFAMESLEANRLYWMTDRTPHASLPLLRPAYRQWFRVVTSPVGVWFAKHSTPNPFGIMPNCRIDSRDKFEVSK